MKRSGILLSLLAVALTGMFIFSARNSAQAADDPQTVVDNVIAAFNAGVSSGDGSVIAAMFTEQGVFSNRDGAFAAVGRPALTFGFSDAPDEVFSLTLISSDVDGDTVTGSVELVDQDALDAGVERYIQLFTATVEDGLVSSLVVQNDLSDPDTQTYADYLESLDDGPGEAPPGSVEIELAGDQPGVAVLADIVDGISAIGIGVEPGEEGVWQPAHVHTGTCEEPGGIVYPLAYPVDGVSFTILSTSTADLLSHDYIVNVHLSEADPMTYVSCGVLASSAAPTPTPSTPETTLPNTGTGGDSSADLPWLIAALALTGVAGVTAAGAVAARRR